MTTPDRAERTDDKPGRTLLTPERFLWAVIAVIAVLFLADQLHWAPFDRLKGWSVLTALSVLALTLVSLFTWYATSRFLQSQFRFSMRWLLMLMTSIAATLGWFAHELRSAKRQQVLVAEIEAAGGDLLYKWQMGVSNARPTVPAPKLFCDLLGVDFFSNPYAIQAGQGGGDDLFGNDDWTSSDSDLAKWRYMDSLEFISIAQSPITNVGLSYLHELKALTSLTLNGAQITDEGLAHLQDLHHLQSLLLGSTPITSNGLVHLRTLNALENLVLSNTQITDEGLVHLARLKKLKTLYLSGTPVTDAGLKHLIGLSQLKRLFLDKTQVTDAGVAELRQTLPLCDIRK